MADSKKIYLECPCCGAEVKHLSYAFSVLQPPAIGKWYVCGRCKSALSGDDQIARQATEKAFLKHLDLVSNA
jgi:hypothetical protein